MNWIASVLRRGACGGPRGGWWIGLLVSSIVLAWASVGHAQANACAIDYDGDGLVTAVDVALFQGLFAAGSSNADLNADLAVDGFDVSTGVAYAGFAVCPWRVDYQYNRVIDTNDWIFFQQLYVAGSLRADLDNDGFTTPADFGLFLAVYATTY